MIFFDAHRQPARDQYGFTVHPDLDLFTVAGAYDQSAFRRAGFDLHQLPLESDNPTLLKRYAEDPHALIDWVPEVPEGDGWRLVGLYDTENDPVAIFIRPIA